MPRPPLLALLLAVAAAAAAPCPTDLPAGCVCKESDGRLSISCVSAPLAAVLPKLANRSIDSLRLVNCSVPGLERQLAPLKGLRTLELAHCGIGSVDPKALDSMAASLKELSLANNRLTEVPRLTAFFPALARLTLNRNLISDLPPAVFSFAPSIVELRLEENRVCTLQFASLDEIKSSLALLDLSGNCLSTLSSVGVLRGAPALAYLDLSSNKLTELSPLSLMNLPSLVEVRLSDNLLSRLLPLSISATPELRYVYLQNNLLDSLSALPPLAKLELLDARANRLTKIPSLVDSPLLRQLRLDTNRIAVLESRALVGNPKLQLLSIQDNSLTSLSGAPFEGLSELVVLLLANNKLTKLDGSSLTPLRSLQQLNLHNNSLSALSESSLAPLKQLTTLDLGTNTLQRLPKAIFESLPKLFWVDLSGNELTSFDKGTFAKRISNLLLGDNPLICDEALDWFVQWLVVNRVRTFLPSQPEVVCSAPVAYEGVKLRDLMIKKANETMKVIGLQPEKPKAGQALVSNLLPGMSLMNSLVPAGQQAAQAAAGIGQIPGLGALLNGIPSLRNLPLAPGVGGVPAGGAAGLVAPPAGSVRSMNSALEQFAAPLVRFATGGQPQAADFEQRVRYDVLMDSIEMQWGEMQYGGIENDSGQTKLMQSIPKMIEAAPGGAAAVIDVSKLPPDVIAHVLRGGQIPGIPRETLERLVASHMEKMAEVATAIGRGEKRDDVEKYLPPLDRLPSELISSVMNGQSLQGLTPDQMEPIKQYYLNTLPLASSNGTAGSVPSSSSSSDPSSSPPSSPVLPSLSLTPQSLEMMRLLPAGYNISRIPVEITNAISKGEMPDLRLLPADLQEHLKSNTDKMLQMFQSASGGGDSTTKQDIRAVLEKLPKWERPTGATTYSPYDLNDVRTDVEADKKAAAQTHMYRLMTAGVIGLLALISVIGVVSMCIAQSRKLKEGEMETSSIDQIRANSTPTILSQPRDSSTHNTQRGIVHRRSPTQNL
ncbi:hypothetical protein PRIPAC_90311 [Pristionchus pacificus]|uniref:Egg-6 n=1 Tax=Pristionchus pacificus TaxID=54126 RepID=A0A2A6B6A7_PRIPA|nr:hypothetical protein PRIPAC_90311 [Pristionchus pacificus]|eukprot:PDM61404.1 egg-6 [Pristionchus pacificus]